ncbi:MAG: hypoxanthine phosphoribosyltransferase [Bacteroidetes bacterium]|nr:hypoxanthine phosphoribosyltransferase [Bacteroidota bacterium]
MEDIKINKKRFERIISRTEITMAVERVASKINKDLKKKNPVFVVVLNGGFFFGSDLLKLIKTDCSYEFVKASSYKGAKTTGKVKFDLGFTESVKDRVVVIVEDIIDTGTTIEAIFKELKKVKPKQIKVASLLMKTEAYKKDIPIDYVGIKVPNRFLVGYGLDYDGHGRNLQHIYTMINSNKR